MNLKSHSRRDVLLCLGAALCPPLTTLAAAAGAALPGDSIYQLHAPLTDQNGQAFELATLRGQPVLVSMFYTSCQLVCPMIFETIHKTIRALAPDEQNRLKIMMITIDPSRDTVDVLKRTAEAHGCGARWILARSDEAETRKIAAVLGIQYRRLASGDFNHSSTIEMLDSDGRIAARSGILGAVDPALVQSLRQALSVQG